MTKANQQAAKKVKASIVSARRKAEAIQKQIASLQQNLTSLLDVLATAEATEVALPAVGNAAAEPVKAPRSKPKAEEAKPQVKQEKAEAKPGKSTGVKVKGAEAKPGKSADAKAEARRARKAKRNAA